VIFMGTDARLSRIAPTQCAPLLCV